MDHVGIIFTSSGGNTEFVIEKVSDVLAQQGLTVTCYRAEVIGIDDLERNEALIFAAPTYGVGEIHYHFNGLLKAMKGFDLKGKKCAIISLVDIKYHPEYHNEGANILTQVIADCHGVLVNRPLRMNGSPVGQEEKVDGWAKEVGESLKD